MSASEDQNETSLVVYGNHSQTSEFKEHNNDQEKLQENKGSESVALKGFLKEVVTCFVGFSGRGEEKEFVRFMTRSKKSLTIASIIHGLAMFVGVWVLGYYPHWIWWVHLFNCVITITFGVLNFVVGIVLKLQSELGQLIQPRIYEAGAINLMLAAVIQGFEVYEINRLCVEREAQNDRDLDAHELCVNTIYPYTILTQLAGFWYVFLRLKFSVPLAWLTAILMFVGRFIAPIDSTKDMLLRMLIEFGICFFISFVLFLHDSFHRRLFRSVQIQAKYREEAQVYRGACVAILEELIPPVVLTKLAKGEHVIDISSNCSVCLTNIYDFGRWTNDVMPIEAVRTVEGLVAGFDKLVLRHGIEKVKSVGDAYVACSGLREPRQDHARRICMFHLSQKKAVERLRGVLEHPVSLCTGVFTGPGFGAVVGSTSLWYDVYGDAIDIPLAMCCCCAPNVALVSEQTVQQTNEEFLFEMEGEEEGVNNSSSVPVEYRGQTLPCYRLLGLNPCNSLRDGKLGSKSTESEAALASLPHTVRQRGGEHVAETTGGSDGGSPSGGKSGSRQSDTPPPPTSPHINEQNTARHRLFCRKVRELNRALGQASTVASTNGSNAQQEQHNNRRPLLQAGAAAGASEQRTKEEEWYDEEMSIHPLMGTGANFGKSKTMETSLGSQQRKKHQQSPSSNNNSNTTDSPGAKKTATTAAAHEKEEGEENAVTDVKENEPTPSATIPHTDSERKTSDVEDTTPKKKSNYQQPSDKHDSEGRPTSSSSSADRERSSKTVEGKRVEDKGGQKSEMQKIQEGESGNIAEGEKHQEEEEDRDELPVGEAYARLVAETLELKSFCGVQKFVNEDVEAHYKIHVNRVEAKYRSYIQFTYIGLVAILVTVMIVQDSGLEIDSLAAFFLFVFSMISFAILPSMACCIPKTNPPILLHVLIFTLSFGSCMTACYLAPRGMINYDMIYLVPIQSAVFIASGYSMPWIASAGIVWLVIGPCYYIFSFLVHGFYAVKHALLAPVCLLLATSALHYRETFRREQYVDHTMSLATMRAATEELAIHKMLLGMLIPPHMILDTVEYLISARTESVAAGTQIHVGNNSRGGLSERGPPSRITSDIMLLMVRVENFQEMMTPLLSTPQLALEKLESIYGCIQEKISSITFDMNQNHDGGAAEGQQNILGESENYSTDSFSAFGDSYGKNETSFLFPVHNMGDTMLVVGPLIPNALMSDKRYVERAACRSACAMIDLVRSLKTKLPFAVTCALSSGLSFETVIGTQSPSFDIFGSGVRTARALLTAAPPGTAVASENFKRVMDNHSITLPRFENDAAFCAPQVWRMRGVGAVSVYPVAVPS